MSDPSILYPAAAARGKLIPQVGRVIDVVPEATDIVSIRIELPELPTFEPGQVGQLGIFGVGEATFVISSAPHEREYIQFTVAKVGEVTQAIHDLSPGDAVGVRAPLGKGFLYRDWYGKNVVIAGGGIGMAPLRPLLLTLLNERDKFGDVTLIYGARTPELLSYGADRADWTQRGDLDYVETIDVPVDGWEGRTGFVPAVLEEVAPSADNAVAVTCGPPIMIKFTLPVFEKLGFAPENVVTTLERRMKCGIGICGRCNIGHKYVCVDGPVFTQAELNELPAEL
jgi:sulfhydrogenase subunit gamma (sulfur reductase)